MTDASSPVVFLDTETTGLDPTKHWIWEVGLIDRNGIEHSWQIDGYLSGGEVDPAADEINGRPERFDPDRSMAAEHFLEEFLPLVTGAHLAGAVVSFDEERLRRMLLEPSPIPGLPDRAPWHYHLIDVEALAVGYLVGRGSVWAASRPWSSEDLSLGVGVEPDDFDRHTALGDARWAKAVYEAVMA